MLKHNSTASDVLLMLWRLWRWQSTLDCEMSSSPDTLQVLLNLLLSWRGTTTLRDVELAWYSSSATQWIYWGYEGDQPHWTVKYRAHLILSECYSLDLPRWWRWPTTRDWEMPSSLDTLQVLLTGTEYMVWTYSLESRVLGLPYLAWKMFFVASAAYGPVRTSEACFRIRLYFMFISAIFKSYTSWRYVQYVSAHTTNILPNTTDSTNVTTNDGFSNISAANYYVRKYYKTFASF